MIGGPWSISSRSPGTDVDPDPSPPPLSDSVTLQSFQPSPAVKIVEHSIGFAPREEAHESLDMLTADATVYVQALKSLRNARATISMLPEEVLATILSMAVEPRSDFTPCSWAEHVRTSAVCKHWRSVALRTPAFWSSIPLEPCRHLAQMRLRAKRYLRSVSILFPHSQMGRFGPTSTQRSGSKSIVGFPPERGKERITRPYSTMLATFPRLRHPTSSVFQTSFLISHCHPSPFSQRREVSTSTSPARPRRDRLEGLDPCISNLLTLEMSCIDPPPPKEIFYDIISSSPHLARLVC